jgi:hypothetical protein
MADQNTTRTQHVIDQGGPDVAALSDPAKRQAAMQASAKQGLGQVFDGQPGNPQSATALQLQQMYAAEGTPEQQIEARQKHLAAINLAIQDLRASGTNNAPAMRAYMEAARLLQQQIADLQAGPSMAAAVDPAQNSAKPMGGTTQPASAPGPVDTTPGAGGR